MTIERIGDTVVLSMSTDEAFAIFAWFKRQRRGPAAPLMLIWEALLKIFPL